MPWEVFAVRVADVLLTNGDGFVLDVQVVPPRSYLLLVYVPFSPDWGTVPPGQRSKPSQEDPEGCRIGLFQIL